MFLAVEKLCGLQTFRRMQAVHESSELRCPSVARSSVEALLEADVSSDGWMNRHNLIELHASYMSQFALVIQNGKKVLHL